MSFPMSLYIFELDKRRAGHPAKLCFDAEVQTEVRLDLAISCQGKAMECDDT
jgi:hypothetical protein